MSYMGLVPIMRDYAVSAIQFQKLHGVEGKIRILEIGVDRGQTTIPLIHNLREEGINFEWYGIDIRHDGNLGQQLILMNGLDPVELENTSSVSKTAYMVGNSFKLLPKLKEFNMLFDIVLIDGDHNYETVKNELSFLSDLTHPFSLVVCDDYGGRHGGKDDFYSLKDTHKDLEDVSTHLDTENDKGGVRKAVDEFVEGENEWGLYKITYFGIEDPVVLVRSLRLNYDVKEPDDMVRGFDPVLKDYRYFIHHESVKHVFNLPLELDDKQLDLQLDTPQEST